MTDLGNKMFFAFLAVGFLLVWGCQRPQQNRPGPKSGKAVQKKEAEPEKKAGNISIVEIGGKKVKVRIFQTKRVRVPFRYVEEERTKQQEKEDQWQDDREDKDDRQDEPPEEEETAQGD